MAEKQKKKTFDQKGELAKLRYSIGADILLDMDKGGSEEGDKNKPDLPLPNVCRLARVMQEYFVQEGYADTLAEKGYSWRPTEGYWLKHISDVCAYLRKERKSFFIFVQEQGTFKGRWQFVTKQEYIETLARNYSDVKTRTETYNGKLEDGKERWKIDLPGISRVPLLQRN